MATFIGGLQEFIGKAISPKGKRGIIRSWLPKALEEGYSGAEALEIFKERGWGIRKKEYYSIWRDVKGIEEQSQRIKFVRRSASVNPNLFGTLLKSQDEKYLLFGRYFLNRLSVPERQRRHFLKYAQ